MIQSYLNTLSPSVKIDKTLIKSNGYKIKLNNKGYTLIFPSN